jgi:hypothetical protein
VTDQAGVVVCVARTVHLVDWWCARALLLERSGAFGKSFGRLGARLEILAANDGLLSGNHRSARQKDYP